MRSRGSSTLKRIAHSSAAPKTPLTTEDTVAMQQVTGSPKPAEERSEGEAIDSGEAPGTAMRAAGMRARAVVAQRRVTEVKVP
jgi:hypothetical protein